MERNKFYGLLFVVFGALSVIFNEGDVTFLVLSLILGGGLYITGKDAFTEEEY